MFHLPGGELLTEDVVTSFASRAEKNVVEQTETMCLGRDGESPEDEQKDGMNSMFESLMADFDKHEDEKSEYKSEFKSEYRPLYLRLDPITWRFNTLSYFRKTKEVATLY